jgi:hypothetical protein
MLVRSLFGLLLLVQGCGGATKENRPPPVGEPMNGGPDDLAPSDAGVFLPPPEKDDAGSKGPREVIELDLSNCPDTPPSIGASCEAFPLLCSYGDSQIAGCRTYLQCRDQASTWEPAIWPTSCVQVPPSKCPATVPSGLCPINDTEFWNAPCVYPAGVYCYCEAEGWDCRPAPSSGCPESTPNFGDTCDSQGLRCKYGDPCRGGGVMICRTGYWQPVGVSCPG